MNRDVKNPEDAMGLRMISSAYGYIAELLIVYPDVATTASDLVFSELLTCFDRKGTVIHKFTVEVPDFRMKTTRYRHGKNKNYREVNSIVSSTDISAMLKRWAKEIKAAQGKGYMTYSRWAQDPFVVLEFQEMKVLLQSFKHQKACDFFLPLELAAQSKENLLVQPTALYLEGGNILKGQGKVLVGKDLVEQNVEMLNKSEEEVLAALGTVLGTSKLLPIGSPEKRKKLRGSRCWKSESFQPLFHIDMFISFGGIEEEGKEVIFIGSPKLCSDLILSNKSDIHYSVKDIDVDIPDKVNTLIRVMVNSSFRAK